MGETGSHELNVKIGLIKDNNLLKILFKSEAGSLGKLLEYAKTNDGKIIKNKDIEFNYINIGNFDVMDGAYYYMYTYYTNEDGLYRNLDDIKIIVKD